MPDPTDSIPTDAIPTELIPADAILTDATAPHESRLWRVCVSVTGAAVPVAQIRAALERLGHHHPFLLEARYADDRAELRYWEEGPDAQTVAALAGALWELHRVSAGLPDWQVVGIEVVDRATVHERDHRPAAPHAHLVPAGVLRPF
jgi:hypothetical protein